MSDTGVSMKASLYAWDGNGDRTYAGDAVALEKGVWTEMTYTIPELAGACIEQAGVLLMALEGLNAEALKAWPFFNEMDNGFNMENYGHEGSTNNEGLGIGEFTIYDWGNGAASECYERILDHWGSLLSFYTFNENA